MDPKNDIATVASDSASRLEAIAETPARRWRGHLDKVEHDRIDGWAFDAVHPETRVVVRLFDNGVPIADIAADGFREDLKSAGIGDGRHSFRFELSAPLNRAQRHVVEVRVAGSGRALMGSPRTLEAQPDSRLLPVVNRAATAWRGSLDVVTRERIEGWAWDPQSPNTRMTVTVLDNGEVIAKLVANRHRKDLENAGIGDGRHAFTWAIPGGLTPLKRHVIQVLGESDGCELPSSPVVLSPSGKFDDELQRAIESAIAGMASHAERAKALEFLAGQMEDILRMDAYVGSRREVRLIGQQLLRRWGKASVSGQTATASAAPKRILVIDDFAPEPERDAGSNCILSHIQAFQKLGFEVSFVATQDLAVTAAAQAHLKFRDIHLCCLPYYASVEEVLRRQTDCFDLIYIHRANNADRYLALARQHVMRARIVYSVADLHFLRLARQAQVEERPDVAMMSRRIRQRELIAAARADVVITHSSVEAQLLRQAVAGCNVHVVPWTVPLRPSDVSWTARRGVAFIGSYRHSPNVDAARFLVEQIMPKVWQSAPDIPCLLVGSGCNDSIEKLAQDRVQIVGHIPLLGSILERVRVTAAPLRYGAGVKGKVLDSLAAGVPCVLSPIAAEGLPLPELLVKNATIDSSAFAAQIVRLHEDPVAFNDASRAGLDFIRDHNSDEVVVELLKAASEGRRLTT